MQHSDSAFTGKHGTRIVYDVWTPELQPVGILLLVHGLGEHARRYDHVVEALAELGLVVYAPDHRGHGRSGGPRLGLPEWSDFTDDLHHLAGIARAQHPGLDVYVLGHSMGGTIALDYALNHQDELAGLVLSGPAVQLATGTPKVVVAVGKVVGRYVPQLPVEKLEVAAISRDPEVVKAYREDPLVHHGLVPAGIARHLVLTMESFPERLPSLTLPLLVMHGGADRITDPNGSRLIERHAGSKDLTLHVYDGFYHEIFNEPEADRRKVLADVENWLAPRLPLRTT